MNELPSVSGMLEDDRKKHDLSVRPVSALQ